MHVFTKRTNDSITYLCHSVICDSSNKIGILLLTSVVSADCSEIVGLVDRIDATDVGMMKRWKREKELKT